MLIATFETYQESFWEKPVFYQCVEILKTILKILSMDVNVDP